MNQNAKDVIQSLVKARAYVYEACAEISMDDEKDIEAVWDGYLTVVSTVYQHETYDVVLPTKETE